MKNIYNKPIFLASLLSLIIVYTLSCSSSKDFQFQLKPNKNLILRGTYLTNSLASCGLCHSPLQKPFTPLSGGVKLADKYGEIYSPNITPAKSGIKNWKPYEIVNAIREGKRPDGSKFSNFAFHKGYEWLSNDDAFAIAFYLLGETPIENTVPKREISFIKEYTQGLLDSTPDAIGYVPKISKHKSLEYGRYLVNNVARCTYCHNSPEGFISEEKYLTGGKKININGKEIIASPLLGSLSGWTPANLAIFLKTGKTPYGKIIPSNICPTSFYRNANNEDIVSIAKYIISIQ